MKRALAIAALLVALPAAAQWQLPDNLPPLPEGGAVCNDAGTHCLINKADLLGLDLIARIAGEKLAEKDREIDHLRAQLALEQAMKHPSCATVQKIPVPVPGARKL